MHIPWSWAKQRPQFLATELIKYFDIKTFFKKPFSKKNQSDESPVVPIKPILLAPYNAKFKLIRIINKFLFKIQVKKTLTDSRYIWLTSPDLFDMLPSVSNSQIVIYDCMDDMLEFSKIRENRNTFNFFKNSESRLVNRANYIFVSSEYLKNKLCERYNTKKNIFVLNNALTNSFFNSNTTSFEYNNYRKSDKINLVYIGTIAKWMNWEIILKSISNDNSLCYHFFGPLESEIPQNPMINYYGTVEHKYIRSIMDLSDILIMPFIMSELISSVNPVKLYEYIYSGKASLSIRYAETEKFEDFVFLYSTLEEYIDIVEQLKCSNFKSKKNLEESFNFCRKNTWEIRAQVIYELLTKN